jgi:AcrR family transcriptional regulator
VVEPESASLLTGIERLCKYLDMRSIEPTSEPCDDRSTRARIRDAAIECIAEHGTAATTARGVARAAGVSTGLVIHHFGSMEGLRAACDEHVVATIRRIKSEAITDGLGIDPLATFRRADHGPVTRYLARRLVDDGPAVGALVDDMVSDAEAYMERSVEAGILRPSADPRGRAAILVLWSLGALVLHRHTERILGVDLTAPDLGSSPAVIPYSASIVEMFSDGVLTEEYSANLRSSLAAVEQPSGPPSGPPA